VVDRRLVSSHPQSMWIMSEKVALADERVARIFLPEFEKSGGAADSHARDSAASECDLAAQEHTRFNELARGAALRLTGSTGDLWADDRLRSARGTHRFRHRGRQVRGG
jgi:hypothetical protein